MRTIDKILYKVNGTYGAPMGRDNVGIKPLITDSCEKCQDAKSYKTHYRIYDCRVVLDDGGYDKGGAYWGLGAELRVRYNKCLTYIKFYRTDAKPDENE